MATMAAHGKDAAQTAESGSEFHRRWSGSWIGRKRCFGGKAFPHSLILVSCEGDIHPSLDAGDPRNLPLFSSSLLLLAAQVTSFCLDFPEQWQPGRTKFSILPGFPLSRPH